MNHITANAMLEVLGGLADRDFQESNFLGKNSYSWYSACEWRPDSPSNGDWVYAGTFDYILSSLDRVDCPKCLKLLLLCLEERIKSST